MAPSSSLTTGMFLMSEMDSMVMALAPCRHGAAFEAIWAGADVRTELERVETRMQELVDLAALRRRQRRAGSPS